MVMPQHIKKYYIFGLSKRYTLTQEHIIDLKARWVVRLDGVLLGWCDDRDVAETLAKTYARNMQVK